MSYRLNVNDKNSSTPNYRKSQSGLSMIAVMLIVTVCVIFGMVAFKVGPAYAEYLTIATIAEDVSKEKELLAGPKSKVWKRIDAAFGHNNLWDAKPKERIRLEKDPDRGTVLHVDYEARANLFFNLYIVTKFEKEAGAVGD